MAKITSTDDLKNEIQQLEYIQASREPALKLKLLETYESIKPINLLKTTIREAIASPNLHIDTVNAAISFSIRFIAKKVFTENAKNPLTELLTEVVEVSVLSIVSQKMHNNSLHLQESSKPVLVNE